MGAKNAKISPKTKDKKEKHKSNNNIIIKNDNINNINLQYSIKSAYIIKKVFLFINEKIKLELIIYNKKLQNLFNIELRDYKKKSNKYRIIDKNGLGKEFILDTNKLLFEGKYQKNKRNGIGKEFYENGRIKFEGKYLNGKRNGEGQKLYENGKLKFKGEYLNDKKWNGIAYGSKNSIVYWLENGAGYVTKFSDDGTKTFEGNYLND